MLLLVVGVLDSHNPFLGVLVLAIELQDLGISDEGFFRLFAFLVEDPQVVPNFTHLRVESSCLDYVVEGVSVISIIIIKNGKSGPVDSLSWVLVCGLLEIL